MAAYSNGSWPADVGPKGHRLDVTADFASDDFARVMKLKVLRGRWFQPDDEGANFLPMVVDADVAMAMFGKLDVVGTKLPAEGFRADPSSPKDMRVVGVIAPYRKAGELSSETRMVFFRSSFLKPQTPETQTIVLAVRPGTPPSFATELSAGFPGALGVTYAITLLCGAYPSWLASRIEPADALRYE